MEIYKLRDEVSEEWGKRVKKADERGSDGRGDGGRGGELKITGLKAGVKNPERVNVYVNSRYVLSLDVAQVVELGVKVGRVLTELELAELKRASEFGKVYQRALEWALMRPRSVRELREYLRRGAIKREAKERKDEWERARELADAIASGEDTGCLEKRSVRATKNVGGREKYDFDNLIVERLCERGYVDDRRFAEFWVENRFVKKGVSRKRLKMELVKKGIAKDIIEEVLMGRSDEEEIRKMIAKKRGKYGDVEKLIAYLCRQGFSYDLVRQVVDKDDE